MKYSQKTRQKRGICRYNVFPWNRSPLARGESDCGGLEANLTNQTKVGYQRIPSNAHIIVSRSINSKQCRNRARNIKVGGLTYQGQEQKKGETRHQPTDTEGTDVMGRYKRNSLVNTY